MLLEWMSRELLVAPTLIKEIASSASHRYRTFTISGRRSGQKTVHHPARQLKALQRWLLRRVVVLLPVHDAAVAYRKGLSIVANGRRHVDSRFLLRMDFEEFFPSLTGADVKRTLSKAKNAGRLPAEWSDDDTYLFARLVCRHDRLTIGAPTSPGLCNAICFDLDEQLTALAGRYDATYTRYADDLFFSSGQSDVMKLIECEVKRVIRGLCHPEGIRLNNAKTRHSSMRGRRLVTGIVLTPQHGISLGRKMKRYLRSQVFKLDNLTGEERRRLRGWLSYSRSVEPDFLNRLMLKFGAAQVNKARSP